MIIAQLLEDVAAHAPEAPVTMIAGKGMPIRPVQGRCPEIYPQ